MDPRTIFNGRQLSRHVNDTRNIFYVKRAQRFAKLHLRRCGKSVYVYDPCKNASGLLD